MLDKIISSLRTRLNYLINNTENKFIIDTAKRISAKVDQVSDRKFKSQESLDEFCNFIIDNEISKMKRVITEETNMVYRKMNEAEEYIREIQDVYFRENVEN